VRHLSVGLTTPITFNSRRLHHFFASLGLGVDAVVRLRPPACSRRSRHNSRRLHQPSLAYIHERASVGKPTFALSRSEGCDLTSVGSRPATAHHSREAATVTTTLLPAGATTSALTPSCECALPVLNVFDAEIVTSKIPVCTSGGMRRRRAPRSSQDERPARRQPRLTGMRSSERSARVSSASCRSRTAAPSADASSQVPSRRCFRSACWSWCRAAPSPGCGCRSLLPPRVGQWRIGDT
jgi:hypothetical protein